MFLQNMSRIKKANNKSIIIVIVFKVFLFYKICLFLINLKNTYYIQEWVRYSKISIEILDTRYLIHLNKISHRFFKNNIYLVLNYINNNNFIML